MGFGHSSKSHNHQTPCFIYLDFCTGCSLFFLAAPGTGDWQLPLYHGGINNYSFLMQSQAEQRESFPTSLTGEILGEESQWPAADRTINPLPVGMSRVKRLLWKLTQNLQIKTSMNFCAWPSWFILLNTGLGLVLLVDQHGVFDKVGGKTSTPASHASRQVWIPMIFQPGVHWLVLVWCWFSWWTSIAFLEKLADRDSLA